MKNNIKENSTPISLFTLSFIMLCFRSESLKVLSLNIFEIIVTSFVIVFVVSILDVSGSKEKSREFPFLLIWSITMVALVIGHF